MKLLVLEDETGLRDDIAAYMAGDGNICESCTNLQQAMAKLNLYHYDCVLLDISLPDGEGFEVLEFLKRSRRDEAVIVISARNSLTDKVKGLNTGADDYLIKPFHLAELKARIEAVYRRRSANGNNEIIFNEIAIDLLGRNVKINGKAIVLTRKEYDILLYFIANREKVIAKAALAEHLWGDQIDMHDNHDFIYTHIKNLRKKLLDASCADYIKSIYGIGYKFSGR